MDESGRNHMAFIAKGEEYRFFVNGVEIPLEVDASDRAVIEEYVDRFRYVSDGKWYGYYNRFGSAKTTIYIGISPIDGKPSYVVSYPPIDVCVP